MCRESVVRQKCGFFDELKSAEEQKAEAILFGSGTAESVSNAAVFDKLLK